MDNLFEKRERLLKKKKLINLLLFPVYMLWWFIIHSSWVYVETCFMIISNLLKLDNYVNLLMFEIFDYFYLYSPLLLFIGGKIEIKMISKEIKELDNKYTEYLETISKKMVNDVKCEILDEKEIRKVYDIVERFANLPRSKQMEVLNYIKGDLNLQDRELCVDINKLDNQYRDTLLTECEDILFPDIDEDKNSYVKKKEK